MQRVYIVLNPSWWATIIHKSLTHQFVTDGKQTTLKVNSKKNKNPRVIGVITDVIPVEAHSSMEFNYINKEPHQNLIHGIQVYRKALKIMHLLFTNSSFRKSECHWGKSHYEYSRCLLILFKTNVKLGEV